MIEVVFDAVVGSMFGARKRRGPVVEDGERFRVPAVTEGAARALARDFERWWETERGFVLDAEARGYRGIVLGQPVLVRPGLDGSTPSGAEAEIGFAHEEAASYLLTPKHPSNDAGSTDLTEPLSALFEEPRLRSIGVFHEGIRLRFAPMTPPEPVLAAVDAVLAILNERLRMRAGAAPYR